MAVVITGTEVLWKQDSSKTWRNPGFAQSDTHPAVCVSWNDAIAYTEWLSAQTGQRYHLPTEAEWEYAARAKTQTAYYWGNNPDEGCTYVNGADQTAKQEFPSWTIMDCRDGYVYTAPAGSFPSKCFWSLRYVWATSWEWTCSESKARTTAVRRTTAVADTQLRAASCGAAGWLVVLRGQLGGARGCALHAFLPQHRVYTGGFRLART